MTTLDVQIIYDPEANVWIAESDPIGLVLESDSYDKLIHRTNETIPEMMKENNVTAKTVRYSTRPYERSLVNG